MISIIMPVLDEERTLPEALACLRGRPAMAELVVVDGGSRDATRAVAQAQTDVRLIDAPRGRASQMNAGARVARGEWLLFLHADTRLPADALERIAVLPEAVEAGCFQQAFDDSRRALRWISAVHNWRCRKTAIMYGDQAIFVRRRVFEAVGGYPACAELEDVRLSEVLRARASPVMLGATVVTDSRRFLAQGPLASTLRIIAILIQHRLGRRPVVGRRFFEPVR
jgi:rSAM/selenodomain-associated transferase 2